MLIVRYLQASPLLPREPQHTCNKVDFPTPCPAITQSPHRRLVCVPSQHHHAGSTHSTLSHQGAGGREIHPHTGVPADPTARFLPSMASGQPLRSLCSTSVREADHDVKASANFGDECKHKPAPPVCRWANRSQKSFPVFRETASKIEEKKLGIIT
jgi:hypothetical protein